MDDPFTTEIELCGADGLVDLETLNRLRGLSGFEPYRGAPFACTGDAHLAGEHVRCTSPFHELPLAAPSPFSSSRDGAVLVRVARETREALVSHCPHCRDGVPRFNAAAGTDLPPLWAHQYGGRPGTQMPCELDVDQSFLADLDTVERTGRTLYFQTPIALPATVTATVPLTGRLT